MNYSDLRKLIDKKTIKLIENENWDEILRILQICPEQIYFFKLILEEKFKVSKELNEFPVEKIVYEDNSQDNPNAPFVYYKFIKIFNLIFELLNYKRDFLSKEFKYQLCEILYPKITEFLNDKRRRISSIEKFINNLYVEIYQNYYDDFINHLFLLEYLNKEKPEDIVELFPKIVSKGLYRLGYELIIKFNELIKQYDSETRQILENIILYEKQYYSLRELLEEENKELIEIMEDNRKKLKQEFYKKSINYSREILDSESFKRNPEDIFRYTFDLYSEQELTNLIKKIIELKITDPHYGNRTENSWVYLLLHDIAWAKKSYLFDDFLGDLARLGHLQVVQTYFRQFPEKINKYQEFIFDYLDFFVLDLLKWHFDDFEFKDPINIFKKLLFKDLSAEALISIFFNKRPGLINQFKEIIKEYINFMLKEGSIERGLFYKLDGLLKIYYRAYIEYNHNPCSDVRLLEKVYTFFFSKSIFKEDSFIYNFTLAKYFNQLEKLLQKDIINQLIESKALSSIEFLLTFGYQHLNNYLDDIIAFEPKHDLQSEHFIKILEIILRQSGHNEEIREKISSRIREQVLCPKKAEIYSFLGEFKCSKQVLEQILKNEINLSYLINSYIDYQLVRIELSIINSSQFDLSESIEELIEIENDFNRFNHIQSLLQNFKFKFNNLKARISLYDGFSNLQDKLYQKSKISFQKSSEIYNQLKRTKIKPDNKVIFYVLWKISEFFFSNIAEISEIEDSDELNTIIQKRLINPLLDQQKLTIQIKRLLENIAVLKFDSDLKLSHQLTCEIPTKFCPIPPKILKKCLLDSDYKIIIEWDKGNEKIQTNEPILLTISWQQYHFLLDFEEKSKSFDFDFSFKTKTNVDIRCEDIKKQAGRICFELWIKSTPFIGEQNIKLEFTEKNICGYTIAFTSVIRHYDNQLLENQIIDEINFKIKKYKDKVYKPFHFRLFLEQFVDPEIRFSFLKNILLRVKDYYYTLQDMTNSIVNIIKNLPIRGTDELIFVVLNELYTKSPIFWNYFTKHYINFTSKKIESKKSNKIPEYLSKYTKENRVFLIFIDDVIGSGRQFIKFYKNDFHNQYIKWNIQKNKKFKFYLVAGIGSDQSIDFISNNSIFSESHIRYSRIIRENERAFNKENWDNQVQRKKLKEYLKKIHPLRWGGYTKNITEKGMEYLVVLEWNTPNNTIGCLYKKNENWKPLFPRTKI